MAKELGTNVLLKVGDGGGTEVFTDLAGQTSSQLSGAGNPASTTDKTTGGWGTTIAGTRSATVATSGFANWPDLTGLDALRIAWENSAEINCELVVNSDGDKYTGAFSVTQFDISGGTDDATAYSITLANAGALTWVAA